MYILEHLAYLFVLSSGNPSFPNFCHKFKFKLTITLRGCVCVNLKLTITLRGCMCMWILTRHHFVWLRVREHTRSHPKRWRFKIWEHYVIWVCECSTECMSSFVCRYVESEWKHLHFIKPLLPQDLEYVCQFVIS